MEENPSFFSLNDYQYPSVSDEDFKLFHSLDRKLYGKLINVLGRDATESMKAMAFFHWMEGVAKDQSFMVKLHDFTPPLLDRVVDEALMCVKCTEEENFTGYGLPEIFMISNILKGDYTLKYFHDNRASAFRGIINSLKTVCFRAFDDIPEVKQPNYYSRASLDTTTNATNIDFARASLVPTANATNMDFARASLVPTTNATNIDFARASLLPTPNATNIDFDRASLVPTANSSMNMDFTRASLLPTPNSMNMDFTRGSLLPTPNSMNMDFTRGSLLPTPNSMNMDFTRGSLLPTPNVDMRRVPTINNPSRYAPIGAGAGGGAGGGNFLESMIPTENKIEEQATLNNCRMMSLFSHNHFLGSASNIEDIPRGASRPVPRNPNLVPSAGALNMEEFARAAPRMVPMNPSLVQGAGASNIEEFARGTTRMVPMNPSLVQGAGGSNIEEFARGATRMVPMNPSLVQGAGASNIEEFARGATRMVPMNPSLGPSAGAPNIEDIARGANRMVPMNPNIVQGVGGEMFLRLPYPVPNQMVPYMPPPSPYHGGPNMNLLPPSVPYNFSHASSSGNGVFLPQMLPGPYNYHPHMDIADMFRNNLSIFDDAKDDNEVAPDDRTVFLTFSKGYPISEAEVKDFFTRKFGEDVEAVYMQEVREEEQALYARLLVRTPALLEIIVDGGKAKYNINGKHVWARKYVKKQKNMFDVGQASDAST